jgi:hypothetical protein
VNRIPGTRPAHARVVIPTPWLPQAGTGPRPHDAAPSGEETGPPASAPYVRASGTKDAAAARATTGRVTWRGPPGQAAPDKGTGPGVAPALAGGIAAIQAPSYSLAEDGLGEGTIRRLHAVGLDLHIALGLTEAPQATLQLDRAIAELDAAIGEIRRTLFGFHLGDPAVPRSGIRRCARRIRGFRLARRR